MDFTPMTGEDRMQHLCWWLGFERDGLQLADTVEVQSSCWIALGAVAEQALWVDSEMTISLPSFTLAPDLFSMLRLVPQRCSFLTFIHLV